LLPDGDRNAGLRTVGAIGTRSIAEPAGSGIGREACDDTGDNGGQVAAIATIAIGSRTGVAAISRKDGENRGNDILRLE
jgi:hypothetical protein